MKFLNKVQNDIRSHESELIAQANAFLFIYISAFTTLQAPAGNNVYSNIIAAVFMLLAGLYCFLNWSKIISLFSLSFAAFTAYVYLSILWSPMKEETRITAITLSKLLIMGTLMYNYLATRGKKEYILSAFVVAGITVTLTTIFYYGPKKYIEYLLAGERMGFMLYAINYVAFILIIASLISLWFVLFRKKWWDIVPAIVCLFASVGTGSRASILAFCVGFFLLALFRSKGIWRALIPIIMVILFFLGFKLLELPVFGSLHERLESFLEVFKSGGETDFSTSVRIDMVKWGLEQFKHTPIKGIGFSAGYVVMSKHGSDLGLFHNTFIEMLVGGGIIGFCLYFFMFFYPLAKMIKPAWKGEDTAIIGVVILITYLVLFLFGSEYFEQATPVVLCYFFMTVSDLNKKTEPCVKELK